MPAGLKYVTLGTNPTCLMQHGLAIAPHLVIMNICSFRGVVNICGAMSVRVSGFLLAATLGLHHDPCLEDVSVMTHSHSVTISTRFGITRYPFWRRYAVSLACAALLFSCSFLASAREYHVSPTDPPSRLQRMLDRCSSGDRVILSRGTFTGRITIRKPVSLIGQSVGQTILDGGGTGPVIRITCSGTVFIHNLTVRNGVIVGDIGEDARGGGILNERAHLHLQNVCIESNLVSGGLGIGFTSGSALGAGLFSGGPVVARDCVFRHNQAYGGYTDYWREPIDPVAGNTYGGGAYAQSVAVFARCRFTENYCERGLNYYGQLGDAAGAGICSDRGFCTIVDCYFALNSLRNEHWYEPYHAMGNGAGYAQLDGVGKVLRSVFRRNEAIQGGAIYITGTVSVDDTIFTANTGRLGGAVFNAGQVRIANSRLEQNAAQEGAGIWKYILKAPRF